jgi:hypothetical protein
MNTDVENAERFLRGFKRWKKEENHFIVPTVEEKSLRRFFPVFPLRKGRGRLLLAVLRVGLRDLVEGNGCRSLTGIKTVTCFLDYSLYIWQMRSSSVTLTIPLLLRLPAVSRGEGKPACPVPC